MLLSVWVVIAFFLVVVLIRGHDSDTEPNHNATAVMYTGIVAYLLGPVLLFIDGILMPHACRTPGRG
ncbi:MAG: hypothetical protein AAF288_07370 [Planctomycetota bacterium]